MLNNYKPEEIQLFVENLIVGVCYFKVERSRITLLYANDGCRRMLGYNGQEMELVTGNVERNVISDDLPIFYQGITDILKDDGPVRFSFRTVTLSGGLRWLEVNGNLFSRKEGVSYIVCTVSDISEQKEAEEEMLKQAERLNLLVQADQEIIVDYNAKTDVMLIRKMEKNGKPKEELIPQYFEKMDLTPYHPEDVDALMNLYRDLLKKPGTGVIEYRHKRFAEEFNWFHLTLSSIGDREGYVTRIVGRMLDIQERKLRELDLARRAEKDALSGLYNKGTVVRLIQEILSQSASNDLHAMVVVDLDNFKEVNDNLGHTAGDRLIETAAAKLKEIFRGSDVIGRIGGDEFLVFMRDIGTIANVDILATKLTRELQLAFDLPEGKPGKVEISCSVGISVYPYHGTGYQELFDKADQALYYIKETGKNGYRIFDAAATRAFHVSRKNKRASVTGSRVNKTDLEDLILDVLYEEKEKQPAMDTVLELIAGKFGWQRAYLFCDPEAFPDGENCLSFVGQGYEEKPDIGELERSRMYEQLCDFEHKLTVWHEDDRDLNEMLGRYLTDNGVFGVVYYPIVVNGKYGGSFVFERLERKEHVFDKETMGQLGSILRILDTYLLNSQTFGKVPNIITQIELIDNMDNPVYIVDQDTYRLSFVNKKVLEERPDIKLGEYCYRVLRDSPVPCRNCIMDKLDGNDPHSRCSVEQFAPDGDGLLRYSASWLECTQDTHLCMMERINLLPVFSGNEK